MHIYIDEYGNKFWTKDDLPHREDGPAREWADGTRAWMIDGNYHREDGPARTWMDGSEEWWLNGFHYQNFEWWLAELRVSLEQKIILKLRYG